MDNVLNVGEPVTAKRRPVVALFSGQGSHYRGMGRELFDKDAVFRETVEMADELVRQHLHRSLIDELYGKKQETDWDELLMTHPAILTVELAVYKTLRQRGIVVDYVSGNSLGEYSAAVAAGVFNETEAITLCIEQAKLMQRYDLDGGMLVVMDAAAWREKRLYESAGLFLVSDNIPGHFTVAGRNSDLEAWAGQLKHNEVQYVKLPVRHPFHSPLIEPVKAVFTDLMETLTYQKATLTTFVSGIYAREQPVLSANYFWEVARQYANIPALIRYFESVGPVSYLDLGPSGTMGTFARYNLEKDTESRIFTLMTPFGREMKHLEQLVNQLV